MPSDSEIVQDLNSVAQPFDQRIKTDDAAFRRRFAERMLWLFGSVVLLGPIIGLLTLLAQALCIISTSDIFWEKFASITSSSVASVSGVFGAIIGFYFGAESK